VLGAERVGLKGASMKMRIHASFSFAAFLILLNTINTNAQTKHRIGIQNQFATVNGVRLHYLAAGKGDPVVLLHG
jgi:hypothetical protein